MALAEGVKESLEAQASGHISKYRGTRRSSAMTDRSLVRAVSGTEHSVANWLRRLREALGDAYGPGRDSGIRLSAWVECGL